MQLQRDTNYQGCAMYFRNRQVDRKKLIINLYVCLYLCLSVSLLVNKISAKQMHRFGHGFCKMAAYYNCSDSIEIGDLGSKVKVTVT